MILIVCSKDIDHTLIKGDLLSWHDEKEYLGRQVSIINGITIGNFIDVDDYIKKSPFIILNLPMVDYIDVSPVLNEMVIFGDDASIRKWKIDFSKLELRDTESYYDDLIMSNTKDKFKAIEKGLVRRDTLNAYSEITRTDITIDDIKVLR